MMMMMTIMMMMMMMMMMIMMIKMRREKTPIITFFYFLQNIFTTHTYGVAYLLNKILLLKHFGVSISKDIILSYPNHPFEKNLNSLSKNFINKNNYSFI
jgi:hypothetical protein